MQPDRASRFWIDDWLVEPMLNRVVRGDDEHRLEPKVMQVLLVLAEHPGEPVTKEAFMDRVWGDTVVTDDVLARCISSLRKLFGDDPRAPRFIETLRKVGYRLIAPVAAFEGDAPSSGAAVTEAAAGAAEPRRWSAGRRVLVGVAVVVGLAAFYQLMQVVARPEADPLRAMPFTSFPGVESDPSMSPDGELIAFVWDEGRYGNADIFVKQRGAEMPLRITETRALESQPAFSADGRQLAFVREDGLEHAVFMVPSYGGTERKVSSFGQRRVRGLGWAPQTPDLVAAVQTAPHEPSALFRISTERAEQEQLTTPPMSHVGDSDPSYSPDGTRIAFVRSVTEDVEDILVMPAEGGPPRALLPEPASITGLAWAADGRSLVFAGSLDGASGLWRLPVTGGAPAPIFTAPEGLTYQDVSIASEGGGLAYTQRAFDANIWQFRRTASNLNYQENQLVLSTRWDSNPDIAPDGRRIAFVSKRSGSTEIWTSDRDGGNPVQVTSFGGALTGTPRWSPRGDTLAFVSYEEGQADVYVVDGQGGGLRRLTDSASDETAPAWSHDGRYVYFASDRTGTWQVWRQPVDGGDPVQVTTQGGRMATESRDGRTLYFVKHEAPGIWRLPLPDSSALASGLGDAFTLPYDTTAEARVVDGLEPADWGNWSLARDGLYFLRRRPGGAEIAFYRFRTGVVSRVALLGNVPRHPSFAASDAGDWFLYTQVDRNEGDVLVVENFE